MNISFREAVLLCFANAHFPPKTVLAFFLKQSILQMTVLSCYLLFSLPSLLIESHRHRFIVNFSAVLLRYFLLCQVLFPALHSELSHIAQLLL